MTGPVFTREEWAWNTHAWPDTLAPLRGGGGLAIEVGSFEGRSAIWLADWLGEGGHVLCVEPFSGCGQSPGFGNPNMSEVAERFFANTALLRYQGRLSCWVAPSHLALRLLPSGSAAVVYVDGDHSYDAVRHDAFEAARIVKPGGFVLFDDYGHADYPEISEAVHDFLQASPAQRFETVHAEHQLHLRRRS